MNLFTRVATLAPEHFQDGLAYVPDVGEICLEEDRAGSDPLGQCVRRTRRHGLLERSRSTPRRRWVLRRTRWQQTPAFKSG